MIEPESEYVAFVRLVAGMRHHQRRWFKDKRPADLANAKDYEKRVDARIKAVLNPQPDLFGGTGKEVAE